MGYYKKDPKTDSYTVVYIGKLNLENKTIK
jgi:hypothetical protein